MTPAQVAHIMAPDLFPLLCQAWGESDRPCAFIAYTEAEVRKFIVNEWWGDDTDERVDEVMSDLRGHDWKDEPEWHAEFEIGGVSFKPICESNSRAAVEAALRDAPQAEGWVMVPAEIVDRFPEINTSNYDHDDACALNAWGVELVLAARPSAPTVAEPDELMKFARRWEMLAYMHTRGVPFSVYDHYIGNPERLDYAATLHREYLASELDRASKGTP